MLLGCSGLFVFVVNRKLQFMCFCFLRYWERILCILLFKGILWYFFFFLRILSLFFCLLILIFFIFRLVSFDKCKFVFRNSLIIVMFLILLYMQIVFFNLNIFCFDRVVGVRLFFIFFICFRFLVGFVCKQFFVIRKYLNFFKVCIFLLIELGLSFWIVSMQDLYCVSINLLYVDGLNFFLVVCLYYFRKSLIFLIQLIIVF